MRILGPNGHQQIVTLKFLVFGAHLCNLAWTMPVVVYVRCRHVRWCPCIPLLVSGVDTTPSVSRRLALLADDGIDAVHLLNGQLGNISYYLALGKGRVLC